MSERYENTIRLSIPASTRFLRLARLTAAGLAGDLGYRMDAIEDLRVAADELCAAVITGARPGDELVLTYREIAGGLSIEGSCTTEGDEPPELHGVARELVEILADEYALGRDDGARTFRLVKYLKDVE
jgi:serine/threonine-protein kinase RsbW